MGRSLTSSAKSFSSFLEARDRRQEHLVRVLNERHPATLFLSLNIPGPQKMPPGSEALFLWAEGELSRRIPAATIRTRATDALGPFAILSVDMDPYDLKKTCVALETASAAARLIDLDVYSEAGVQIDRGMIGGAARPCFVCEQPAGECIRAKRHAPADVVGKVHDLLATVGN
jgi:holo-ACP synthase CitX